MFSPLRDSLKSKKIVGSAVLALALAGGATGVAMAQDNQPTLTVVSQSADTETPGVQTVAQTEPAADEAPEVDGDAADAETPEGDGEHEGIVECDFGFDDWSDEELAEMRAELETQNAALKAAFDEAGIAYTEEADEEFGSFIEWDFEDEAANDIADKVFTDIYGDLEMPEGIDIDMDFEIGFDGEVSLEDLGLSAEELTEIRTEIEAGNTALKAAFDAAGISYTETADDELGINLVEWDYDDEAANDVADGVFEKLYDDLDLPGIDIELGDDFDFDFDGDFEDCDFDFELEGCDEELVAAEGAEAGE